MKKLPALILFFGLGLQIFAQSNAQSSGNTSIAMLNYLATEARRINASKDNRLILETTYSKLINNTNPLTIDDLTADYLEIILEDLEGFRMINFQRERILFLYENEKASAIRQSMPNPMFLLGSINLTAVIAPKLAAIKLLATATTMAVDSVFKYQNAKNDARINFLQASWDLDDRESGIVHNLRARSFFYMRDIAIRYDLALSDTLNENSIDNFVEISLMENLSRKRQALESNQRLYAQYAPYWLELADTYYQLNLYTECLNAINQYLAIQAPIFREDKDLALMLPNAIAAAYAVYGNSSAYVALASEYLHLLIINTSEQDWALRYFASQTYIHLASLSNRISNLQAAYDLLLNNVRILSSEQERLLEEYYSPINQIPQSLLDELENARVKHRQTIVNLEMAKANRNMRIGKETERQMEREIAEAAQRVSEWEARISDFREYRERELPPFYNALWVNYRLIIELARELNKSTASIQFVYDIIDRAFWPLHVMEDYWRETPAGDFRSDFYHSIISRNRSYTVFRAFADGWRYGDGQFFLNIPDALLTAVHSINVKVVRTSDNHVLIDEENVNWDVSSSSIRNHFNDPHILLAEIEIHLNSRPEYKRNEEYTMEVFIKNIDERAPYSNRLHFINAARQNGWEFLYVE